MAQPTRQRFSFDDYLALEDVAAVKHEFLEGQVWAMAGGSPDRAAVCANVCALLSNALRGQPCRVYSSDLRVQRIPTLQEVVLVAHDRQEIEVVRREANGSWSRHLARDTESAQLTSVGCELSIKEVYRNPLA